MTCPHCGQKLALRPPLNRVEVGCQGCSRVLTLEEVRALLDARGRVPAPRTRENPAPLEPATTLASPRPRAYFQGGAGPLPGPAWKNPL